jgi:lipopolysaccharide transport system ATP-binding protein
MSSEHDHAPVILAENLGKCYHLYNHPSDRLKQALLLHRRQYFREFWALQGASFHLARGEAVGIIGRNGAGKSTLLQLVAGTLTPTQGSVRVSGRVAALLELGSGFNPDFTGRENVNLNGSILGLSQDEIAARFDEIARFADIGDFVDQPVKTYSSGMTVRLAFAVQVLLKPDVLIVDEALAVGDAEFQRRCYRRLEQLREQGLSLLFVSHANATVRQLCSRAIYLERGRVKAIGPSADVCDQYEEDLLDERGRPGKPKVSLAVDPTAAQSAAQTTSPADADSAERVLATFVPDPSRHEIAGDRRIQILHAEARLVDNPRGHLVEGDRVAIVVKVRVQEEMETFLFGFLFRTLLGTAVFGTSRLSTELGLPSPLKPGDEYTVRVEVQMQVEPGDYFVSFGMQTEGFDQVLFYVNDAMRLTLEHPPGTDPHMIAGFARLPWSISARRSDAPGETDGHP